MWWYNKVDLSQQHCYSLFPKQKQDEKQVYKWKKGRFEGLHSFLCSAGGSTVRSFFISICLVLSIRHAHPIFVILSVSSKCLTEVRIVETSYTQAKRNWANKRLPPLFSLYCSPLFYPHLFSDQPWMRSWINTILPEKHRGDFDCHWRKQKWKYFQCFCAQWCTDWNRVCS